MKKIYLNPEIKIVKVQLAKMIATSNPEGFDGDLGESEGEDGDGGNALGRRRGTVWTDDEEEEEEIY